jgi:hypothetical protein
MEELLAMPKTKAYCYPIIVEANNGCVDVSLLNPQAVPAPKGKRPWGGKNPPTGYYNVNLSKYCRLYVLAGVSWPRLIDTPIINKAELPNVELLSEVLWELTFYGGTSKKNELAMRTIGASIEKSRAEIKSGKCVKVKSKKKGDYTIVIPNSVVKLINDL